MEAATRPAGRDPIGSPALGLPPQAAHTWAPAVCRALAFVAVGGAMTAGSTRSGVSSMEADASPTGATGARRDGRDAILSQHEALPAPLAREGGAAAAVTDVEPPCGAGQPPSRGG